MAYELSKMPFKYRCSLLTQSKTIQLCPQNAGLKGHSAGLGLQPREACCLLGGGEWKELNDLPSITQLGGLGDIGYDREGPEGASQVLQHCFSPVSLPRACVWALLFNM